MRGQLLQEADQLAESAALVETEHENKVRFRDAYLETIRPRLEHPSMEMFQPLRLALPAELHGVLDDLEDICEEQRQLNRQASLYQLLHAWLLVHVPLSIALLALGGVHAVMALRY